MKNIKTYESFFFRKKKVKVNIEDVEEAFHDLYDKNYEVIVDKYINEYGVTPVVPTEFYSNYDNNNFLVTIKEIHSNPDKTFKLSDIKEDLDVSISFLKKELQLKIDKIIYKESKYIHILGIGPRRHEFIEETDELKKLSVDTKLKFLKIYFK